MLRAVLYKEQTVAIALNELVERLNGLCSGIRFELGSSRFVVPTPIVSHPESHRQIADKLGAEAKEADWVIVATNRRYDNNYFFQAHRNIIPVSFFGWEYLTQLPLNNGLAYMIADFIALRLDNTFRHAETTGCIYDFLVDKRGVDIGMRSGMLCSECLDRVSKGDREPEEQALVNDLQSLLNAVSAASKWNNDIVETESEPSAAQIQFDVFLCHNSEDKPSVKNVSEQLKQRGRQPWLDEEQLRPGFPWQRALEEQIASIGAAAVFVGENGTGPWQDLELEGFIRQFVRRQCPVIPVILPSARETPALPVFLEGMMWVDLRKEDPDPIGQLVWGITGRRA